MGGIIEEPTVVTDGVPHCACVDPQSALGSLLIATGKLLPAGAWMDGHSFNYGRVLAAAVVLPSGKRRAVKLDAARLPDPARLAQVLAP